MAVAPAAVTLVDSPRYLHSLGRSIDVEGTPVMRTWQVVHLQSRVLSPAAEAFRYFLIERAEAMLLEQDAPLLRPQGVAAVQNR